MDPLVQASRRRRSRSTGLGLTATLKPGIADALKPGTFDTAATRAVQEATRAVVEPSIVASKPAPLPGDALRSQVTEIASPSNWQDAIPAIYLVKGPCEGDFIRYAMFREDVWNAAIALLRVHLQRVPTRPLSSRRSWPIPQDELASIRAWHAWTIEAQDLIARAIDATNIRPQWLGPVGTWSGANGAPTSSARLTSTGNPTSNVAADRADYAAAWARVLPLLYALRLPQRYYFIPREAFRFTAAPFLGYVETHRATSPGLNPAYVNPDTRFDIMRLGEQDFVDQSASVDAQFPATQGEIALRYRNALGIGTNYRPDLAPFAPGTGTSAPVSAMSELAPAGALSGVRIQRPHLGSIFRPEGGVRTEPYNFPGVLTMVSQTVAAARSLVGLSFDDVVVSGVINWWLQTEMMFELGFVDAAPREQIRQATRDLASQVRGNVSGTAGSFGALAGAYEAVVKVLGAIVGALFGWITKLVGAASGFGPGFPDAPFVRTLGELGAETECMLVAGRIDEATYRNIRESLLPKISAATGVPIPKLESLTDDVPNDPGATLELDAPIANWTPSPSRAWLWGLVAVAVGGGTLYAVTR